MADTLISGTTLVEKESRSIGDVPIGGVVAWLKSLSGVPNLAEGWVECDGSVLSDALSPLNGQTIPDLNDGQFLEGRSTSGSTGGSATMAHTHAGPSHTHTAVAAAEYAGGSTGWLPHADTDAGPFLDPAGTGNTGAASNTENRPPFFTVVWIMRVR